jgi:hypothetical protein
LRTLVLAACAAALALPAVAAARPSPITWCGTDEVTTDRVPALEITSTQQVRVVYAVPADGTDNFKTYVDGIATDAQWISDWWRQQDPARVPRFDRYPFPGCATTYGALDIGFIRLPHPGSYYTQDDTPADRLDDDLQTAFPPNQKTIVYYDGPSRNGRVCGVTDYLADHDGGRFGIAYVLLQSGCSLRPPGGGSSSEVATHELLHNLGAVQPAAPHTCPGDTAHVCDSQTDILYPYLGNGSTLDVVTLDFARDDYYGHGGTWWDVQDSGWLTHLPQFPFSLSVVGQGTVRAAIGSTTLPCDQGCSNLTLDSDAQVAMVAVPAAGWTVGSWSSGCSVSLSCTVGIAAPTAATVTFVRTPVRVSVGLTGKGRVTSTPKGIACAAGTCTHTFAPGTAVRLTAAAASGWRFAGWSGACSGRGSCVTRADASVRARFTRR